MSTLMMPSLLALMLIVSGWTSAGVLELSSLSQETHSDKAGAVTSSVKGLTAKTQEIGTQAQLSVPTRYGVLSVGDDREFPFWALVLPNPSSPQSRAACEVFARRLYRQNIHGGQGARQVTIIWFDARSTPFKVEKSMTVDEICDDMLTHYNAFRAENLRQEIEPFLQGTLPGKGPFLIGYEDGWVGAYDFARNGEARICRDLTALFEGLDRTGGHPPDWPHGQVRDRGVGGLLTDAATGLLMAGGALLPFLDQDAASAEPKGCAS